MVARPSRRRIPSMNGATQRSYETQFKDLQSLQWQLAGPSEVSVTDATAKAICRVNARARDIRNHETNESRVYDVTLEKKATGWVVTRVTLRR